MANKIETILEAVNGGIGTAILTEKVPLFQYENGKKTSEKAIGTKFTVALQGNKLSQLAVKIEGSADPLPQITDEQISESLKSGKFIYVKFIECKVGLYTMNGSLGMTATASSVEIVKQPTEVPKV